MYQSETACGCPLVAVISTCNRARLVMRAVRSALAQMINRRRELIYGEPSASTNSRSTDRGPASVGFSEEYLA